MEPRVLIIEIVKWNDHNSRSDELRHPNWIRVNQDIGISQSLYDLNSGEKWVWILLLAARCKAKTQHFEVNISWFCQTFNVSVKDLLSAAKKLSDSGTITVHRQSTDSPLTGDRQSTGLRTNGTNETRRTNESARRGLASKVANFYAHFPEFWSRYPRKVGKSRAEKIFLSKVKSKEAYMGVMRALENYRADCARLGTEEKYIKHPATFLNSWQDWLEAPSPVAIEKKSPDTWDSKAHRALNALLKHGTGSKAPDAIESEIGQHLWALVLKVGTQKIRDVQRGDFQIRTIAGMLKAAAEGGT